MLLIDINYKTSAQYSSASMMVMTRRVHAGSAGLSEWYSICRIVIIDFEEDPHVINGEAAEIVLVMRIVVTVEAVEFPHGA